MGSDGGFVRVSMDFRPPEEVQVAELEGGTEGRRPAAAKKKRWAVGLAQCLQGEVCVCMWKGVVVAGVAGGNGGVRAGGAETGTASTGCGSMAMFCCERHVLAQEGPTVRMLSHCRHATSTSKKLCTCV